ncbi:MAG: hypothetical protein GOMPHAMPRED_007720 [Gomphillus americanus]|uniref:Enoyl reductase (ER) domain-containing protein n=1 Tax=Gomphillus americanus TaxID=1940652 RepID=A0A8H3I2L0_9LECA|nr:MAG: hypothetical protein GOMPHAMPRED_007720 [Gomphillus americanus]
MVINRAAILKAAGERLVVEDTSYVKPGAGQVLIKVQAAAINVADHILQDTGLFIRNWPYTLGSDVAGTIEEAGPGSSFQPGDRVYAHCNQKFSQGGFDESCAGFGGFQFYTLSLEDHTAKLPNAIGFEQGCVFPLSVTTAYAGLMTLGLNQPGSGYVFVWGGSSSVGTNAIQLFKNLGYTVITTASPRNFGYCREIGASEVFDYNGDDQPIIGFLKGKNLLGTLDAMSKEDTLKRCMKLVDGTVCSVAPGTEKIGPQVKTIYQAQDPHFNIQQKVYGEVLPKALGNGTFKPKPDPLVIGNGLEYAQEGIDMCKKGVSARKVVFIL